jgi:WD40 repeat protein
VKGEETKIYSAFSSHSAFQKFNFVSIVSFVVIRREISMKRTIVAILTALTGWRASAVAQQPAANAKPKATPVRCLAFSRDGRSLAVAYNGSEALIVWDVARHKPVYSARGKVPIRFVAYSPVAELLAVSAGTATKLLDPKIDRIVRELDCNQGPVRDVSFSPDGRQLAPGDILAG